MCVGERRSVQPCGSEVSGSVLTLILNQVHFVAQLTATQSSRQLNYDTSRFMRCLIRRSFCRAISPNCTLGILLGRRLFCRILLDIFKQLHELRRGCLNCSSTFANPFRRVSPSDPESWRSQTSSRPRRLTALCPQPSSLSSRQLGSTISAARFAPFDGNSSVALYVVTPLLLRHWLHLQLHCWLLRMLTYPRVAACLAITA